MGKNNGDGDNASGNSVGGGRANDNGGGDSVSSFSGMVFAVATVVVGEVRMVVVTVTSMTGGSCGSSGSITTQYIGKWEQKRKILFNRKLQSSLLRLIPHPLGVVLYSYSHMKTSDNTRLAHTTLFNLIQQTNRKLNNEFTN